MPGGKRLQVGRKAAGGKRKAAGAEEGSREEKGCRRAGRLQGEGRLQVGEKVTGREAGCKWGGSLRVVGKAAKGGGEAAGGEGLRGARKRAERFWNLFVCFWNVFGVSALRPKTRGAFSDAAQTLQKRSKNAKNVPETLQKRSKNAPRVFDKTQNARGRRFRFRHRNQNAPKTLRAFSDATHTLQKRSKNAPHVSGRSANPLKSH